MDLKKLNHVKTVLSKKNAEDEKTIINGREVRIENYINRSQEVGK